jgi:hypothetical protein
MAGVFQNIDPSTTLTARRRRVCTPGRTHSLGGEGGGGGVNILEDATRQTQLCTLRMYVLCGADTDQQFKGEICVDKSHLLPNVERLYCKWPIICLASSKILTPHPPHRLWCGGWTHWTHSLGGEGGGGVNILENARHSSVLYVCTYFVVQTLTYSPKGRFAWTNHNYFQVTQPGNCTQTYLRTRSRPQSWEGRGRRLHS